MSYEPLHHKYRPQTFKDLIGQETIARTLSNAIALEKIAPAYLFTGPRGTGKTSSARILAKSLNCLQSDKPTPTPCGECEVCRAIARGTALDVIEIDAASNTGVDNIREIIERCRFAPVQCRYKVYAIDECHMLSTAAFNALLKTLEEPPPNVVFILATTDPQRVLSTIISRCQRFDYRRIPLTEMVEHLKYIVERENIAIADDAITLIAQIANGGLRDAESLLDQLSLLPEKITVAKVWDLVGAVPELDLLKLLEAISGGRAAEIIQQCRSLLDRGREPLVVLQNLASFYLNLLIAKTAPERSEMVAVTENCWQELCQLAASWEIEQILQGQQQLKAAETQLKQTTQPRLWLEITLLGLLPTANKVELAMPNVAKPTSGRSTTVNPAKKLESVSSEPNFDSKSRQLEATNGTRDTELEPKPTKEDIPAAKTDTNGDRRVVQLEPTPAATKNGVNSTNHQTPPPVATSHLDTNDEVTNEKIWEKVIQCLQPPTTQALLRQQCHLISLQGSRAIVGIGSAKLQRLHQGKVTNIETAFAKVCQRIIKVKLEVAAPQKTSVRDNITQSVAPAAPQKSQENKEKLEEPATEKPPAMSDRAIAAATTSDVAALPPPKKNLTEPIASPPPVTEQVAPPVTEIAPSADETRENKAQSSISINDAEDADDWQQAIADLTRSFEGELVQLDNYPGERPEVSLATHSENGNDVKSQAELEKSSTSTSSFSTADNVTIKRQDIDLYDEDDENVPF